MRLDAQREIPSARAGEIHQAPLKLRLPASYGYPELRIGPKPLWCYRSNGLWRIG